MLDDPGRGLPCHPLNSNPKKLEKPCITVRDTTLEIFRLDFIHGNKQGTYGGPRWSVFQDSMLDDPNTFKMYGLMAT